MLSIEIPFEATAIIPGHGPCLITGHVTGASGTFTKRDWSVDDYTLKIDGVVSLDPALDDDVSVLYDRAIGIERIDGISVLALEAVDYDDLPMSDIEEAILDAVNDRAADEADRRHDEKKER